MPHLSPDGSKWLVQDGSGLLWQFDAENSKPSRAFSRAVVDYVEDTAWLDDNHFVAVLNTGVVKKVALTGEVVFEQQDVN